MKSVRVQLANIHHAAYKNIPVTEVKLPGEGGTKKRCKPRKKACSGAFWRPREDLNLRPHAQEQTRYDETKCNTVQENPWKYKVFHCFKSYLVSRFISIFIGILHRPIGSKLARLSIFGGRCKCKQIPLCNLSLYEMIGNPIHSRTGVLVFWTPI